MRDDIKQLLESRPIWQEMQDPILKDLKAALEIANAENDYTSAEIVKEMIKVHKQTKNTTFLK